MMTEIDGKQIGAHVLRMLASFRQTWDDLNDEQLNANPPFHPSNTIYQLAVHVAGSTRFWVITDSGGFDFHRQRDAEFRASGRGEDIRRDYDLLAEQIEAHLSGLSGTDLSQDQVIDHASFSGWRGGITQADAVLHALDHVSLHLGHVQIQRQLLGLVPVN
jgi:uncharacterized damage-inducible protein DinB